MKKILIILTLSFALNASLSADDDLFTTGVEEIPEEISLDSLSGTWHIFADGKCDELFGLVEIDLNGTGLIRFPYSCLKEGKKMSVPRLTDLSKTFSNYEKPYFITENIFVFFTTHSYIDRSTPQSTKRFCEYAYILQMNSGILKGRRISLVDDLYSDADGTTTLQKRNAGEVADVVLKRY